MVVSENNFSSINNTDFFKKRGYWFNLEVEQTQDLLTIEGVHYDQLSIKYHSLVEQNTVLVEDNKALKDNWKWATEEIDFQQDWRFEKSEKYEQLYDEHINMQIKLKKMKGKLKELNGKYMDLLKKYFED